MVTSAEIHPRCLVLLRAAGSRPHYAVRSEIILKNTRSGSQPVFQARAQLVDLPLVGLQRFTVIASQAIITGSFSMTRQAMQLGWFPGVRINQTSAEEYGQITYHSVNWTMMASTVALTAGFRKFRSSSGAYGTAVSTTMVLTTALLYHVMRHRWHWSSIKPPSRYLV